MKKFSLIALAVVAAMLFTVPAMAVDVDFSGYYRVRGFFDDTQSLNDDARSAEAKFDQRFRIQPVFKITDRLTLNTKFEGLDRVNWGGPEDAINAERVWVDAEFDMFTLKFGRMAAGTCGLQYCNADQDADRIKVILKGVDPFYLDFTYTKYTEDDYDNSVADQDWDGYSVMGSYKAEGIEAGLLLEYNNDKTISTAAKKYMLIDPFFKGVFGMFTVEAEYQLRTGDYADTGGAGTDVDYDAHRYILDVGANIDAWTFGVAYAHSDGQDANDADFTNAMFGGNDWEPFLITTGFFDHTGSARLGGVGNLNEKNAMNATGSGVTKANGTTPVLGDAGYDIFLVYGSYAAMDNLTLNAIFGFHTADETSSFGTGVDDDLGWEFNIGAKWKIMDNMTYDIKFGMFDPGDFWKFGGAGSANALANTTNDDSTYSIMHSVVVTF